ncbi:Ras like enriched [Fonticula alba]|uniref:Ras like enriched n=1 Tax=Fonticula alba TaxID=691883 RepID=A0A058Z1D4_FONAL|nr:Ras like enriched [Fonticula alba]KCV68055.1 Ras like enriched [Fonticula alba]|eukprot:XP_009497622.1 Ras like enriched [Fonticula alba]
MSAAAPPEISTTSTKTRRLAVLGFRAVGKSSLTIRFVDNHFVDSYYPTIESTYTKTVQRPVRHARRGAPTEESFTLEITDTAGQDEYSILSSKHAVGIHGYVFVYSINLQSSFENCKTLRDKILDATGTDWVPCVLVGNKADLVAQRQVTQEAAEELAKSWRCPFFEASAKHDENINESFFALLDLIEEQNNPPPPPEKSGLCILV